MFSNLKPWKRTIFAILCLIAAVFFSFSSDLSADTSLDSPTLDLISNAVFEVVVPKPTKDSLTYEKPLPLDLMPYAERTDKYHSIGSAFAISPTEFVSAAHVMRLGSESQFKEVCLRDREGKVFGITGIMKYSERRDFVVFTLKDKVAKGFLTVNIQPRMNEKIFAAGNALGEGIVIRDGLYTSNTPEEQAGEWKWIRFSAAASPGNSGGPLLDKDGKVIGVVLQKSANENLNYALPIAEVVQAKGDTAIAHRVTKYFLENILASKTRILRNSISLPKTYPELHRELIEGTRQFSYNLLKSLFVENKGAIFPSGKDANILLNSNEEAAFPGLVSQKETGNWFISYPEKIKDAQLGNNGYLTYGNVKHTLFLNVQKPDEIPLDKIYSDSKLFMDLILKGIYLPRQIGPERIRITSLGKAIEDYSFLDSYGRKWLVRTYPVEYSDEKIVTFSLPVPGGCVTMLMGGPTDQVDDGYIQDMKVLTNFIYLSYVGSFKQWEEFLRAGDFLPAAFSSLELSFDRHKGFRYRSKRLNFSYAPDVMDISEKSQLKLMFSYFKEDGRTVWDVGKILLGESKSNETSFTVARKAVPPQGLGDTHQGEWATVAGRRFPFNNSVYYRDRSTSIATVLRNSSGDVPVLYTAVYSKEGKADQFEMEAKLNLFIKNVAVYDDGLRNDTAYSGRKDAYHDQGDYYQALWDYEKIKGMIPGTVYGSLLRGDVYKDKSDLDHAIADYATAMVMNPEAARSHLGKDFMPLIYGVKGQFQEVRKEIKKVLETDPLNTSAEPLLSLTEDLLNQKIKSETAVHLFRGEALNHLGMPDAALAEYNDAISGSPDYYLSYDIRGLARVFRKDTEGAISDYSKAIELNPRDIIAYNRRGVVYKINNDYDAAIADYSKALEVNPAYVKALKNRGNAYSFKGEYDRAIADYDAALRLYPLYDDAYYDRGLTLHQKGLDERAIEDFGRAIEINPEYGAAYGGRGISYQARGQSALALADYGKALEINPRDARAYFARATLYQLKKELESALADYTRAIEINPEMVEAYFHRGNIHYSQGRYDQAIADYNRLLEINPLLADAYNNRGLLHEMKGALDNALADFSRAIEISPQQMSAYQNRGLVYTSRKEFQRAISDFSKAIEINPRFPRAYLARGNAHAKKGDYGSAIVDYSRAIELEPANAESFHNRGYAFNMKGEYDLAISDFDQAIKINPQYVLAYIYRGHTYVAKGNKNRACSDWRKACELNACESYETSKKAGQCE